MKLYLAVATLMLVLLAHSEAVEEPTIEQHFANIQAKLKEFGEDLSEKTTTILKQIENHEITIKTKSWIDEQLGNLKQRFAESFTKQD
ncbi:apolipoprotein C-I isoform 2 precursor [Silurus asotus]|uniref:Apolipoprotein C-I isoform 2 n=1 Tax=Silurus asotus TaxID=30991 RepID=A0AAD5FL53_SILAS|nr:apolipoprotein C-I isoform 2 precursor [Silurus asotus]